MPQEASVVLGRDTRFMCGVTTLNSLEVTFQWSKYFAPLNSNRHVRISRTDDKNKVSQISIQRGYLEIIKAKYSDEGLYSCEAFGNNKMIVRKDVYLKVQGKTLCLYRLVRDYDRSTSRELKRCPPHHPPSYARFQHNCLKEREGCSFRGEVAVHMNCKNYCS